MLMAVMLLPFASHAQSTVSSFPYTCGFETTDDATAWVFANSANANHWIIGTATDAVNGGTQALYISNDNSSYAYSNSGNAGFSYATLTFEITSAVEVGVSFDWKCNGESTWDFLRAWIAPGVFTPTVGQNPTGATDRYQTGNPEGWYQIGNTLLNLSTGWNTASLNQSLAAGTYTVVLMWYNDGSGGSQPPAAIDNFTITATSCLSPTNLVASNITATSATLTWNGTATDYTLYEYANLDSAAYMYTTTTADLNTLEPNTVYTFGVTSSCGNEESAMTIVTFRTGCAALATLPYTMGFEASDLVATTPNADALPFCWSRYASGTGNYTYFPYSYSSSTYAHSGSRLLYFYDGTGATYPDTMVAILPEVDVATYPMNSNRLTFWGRVSTGSNTKNVQIGTMTDPADMSTFAPVETVAVSGTTHTLYSVPLTNASASAPYLAIMLVKSASGYLCIDDLTIEEMPSCLEISNLAAGNITSSSVELTWSDAANASATYTVYNMADTSVIATGVTGTTYAVTGLDANTQYNFGVAANCPTGDASVMTVSARTSCGAYTLPFTESFSATLASDPCWAGASILYADGVTPTMGANNNWTYTSTASNGIDAGHYRVNIYGSSCYKWLITPEIDLTTATSPMLTFDAVFTAYSGTGAASGFESNDSQLFLVLVSTNNGATWTVASNIALTSIAGTSYATQFVDLSTYVGQTVRLAFYAQSTVSGGDNNLHLDNISIDESTGEICYPAATLAASNVTSNSATITWTGDAASYEIYNMADTSLVATVTTTSYDLTGLTPNTEYQYGVVAICSSSESPWSYVSFRTSCAAYSLPFTESFSATLASDPCWAGASILYADGVTPTMGANNNWTYTSTASNGIDAGHYRVNIYGSSCYKWLITPEIDLTTATSPMLTFDAVFTAYSGTGAASGFESNDSQLFLVLVSTNNGATWTVASNIALTSIAGTSYATQFVDLSTYVGQTVRLAFYAQSTVSGGDNNLHLDNIAIDEVVGEICYPVSAVTVSNVTESGVTLSWTGDADSYTIVDMADPSVALFTVTETTVAPAALAPMTQYTYGIIANCDTNHSDTVTVTFATACSSVTLPFTETFEATSATLGCWTTDGPGNWIIGSGDYTAATGAYEGSHNAKITHGTTGDVTKLISPVLSGVTNGLQLTFAHIQRSWSGDIDNLAVYYRASSDAAWQQLAAYTNEVATWTVESVTIPGTIYQVAFEYTDNYGYGVGIDSVAFVANAGGDTTVVADSVHITYAVNDATMGTTNPAPGTYTYVEGEAFSVTAVPATGYHLADWQMTIDVPDYGLYSVMMGTDTLTLSDTAYINYDGLILTAIFAADGGDTTVVECDPVAIPFVETFETTSTTADCWTSDGPGTWTIATGDYSAATGAYEGSLNASITHGTSGDVTKFISPVLSGVTNGLQLQFAHIQRSWYGDIDNLAVYYRTSSDAVWQQLAAYTNEVAAWTVETINIPGTVYQVAFEYTDNYGYGVGIDSIAFNLPPACMPVVNLTASNVTATGATLSWTGNATSYNVYAIVDSVATLVQNVTVDSIDLTGLTAMTAYTYGVRAVCGTDESEMTTVTFATACGGTTCMIEINGADSFGDGWNGNAIQVMQAGNVIATFTIASGNSASAQIPVCSGYPVSFAWVSGSYPSETSFEIKDGAGMVVYSESGSNLTGGEVFYTMNDACPSCIPAMVAIDTITETSVTISWTGTAASYDVYNGTTLVTNTTNNTYTFTGLTPATTYTFGVQAICSATDTAALATVTVATACADITTLPYTEGFENGLGCWSTVNGSADGMPWYSLNEASYAHSGAGLAVSFSYYNSAMHANAWLISPKFVLPTAAAGDTLNLSWWYRVNADYPLDLYDVMLSTTTNDTAAFTTTLLSVTPDSNNGVYTQMVVDLTAYAGQSVYLAFHHHDSYDMNYLMIDDISLSFGAAPVPPVDTLTVTFAVDDATMGTTIPAPGTYYYETGDTVFFGSQANPGYRFQMWVISVAGENDTLDANYSNGYYIPASALMAYGEATFTAYFEVGNPDSMQVTIAVNDPTMGTTTPAPGVHYYYADQPASLIATPNTGNHLEGWAYQVSVPGYGVVQSDTMPALPDFFGAFLDGEPLPASFCQYEWTVTALFAAGEAPEMHDSVTVNVSVNNETMGVVTPAPGTHYYVLGDTVIMSIMPNPGYRVVAIQMSATHPLMDTLYDETITDSLELAEMVGMNDTLIVDDEDMYGMVININVIFAAEGAEPNRYTVEVAYDQTKGTVTGTGEYVEGSNVRLVAMPATHYEFYAWVDNNTGDTVGRESVYAIANIDRDYFLTAIFVATTSIDDVDMDNVTIYSTDNVIVVRGAEGKQVVLFDVNGRMLSREARAAEQVEFRVNNSGVYLVKVADAAAKRVVVIR